jgi:hypothetical protein
MTLIFELTPELQARLQEEAARRGLAVEECAQRLLEDRLVSPSADGQIPAALHETVSAELWKREFRAWVDSHKGLELIPLSDESLRRESIYEDRGS